MHCYLLINKVLYVILYYTNKDGSVPISITTTVYNKTFSDLSGTSYNHNIGVM